MLLCQTECVPDLTKRGGRHANPRLRQRGSAENRLIEHGARLLDVERDRTAFGIEVDDQSVGDFDGVRISSLRKLDEQRVGCRMATIFSALTTTTSAGGR